MTTRTTMTRQEKLYAWDVDIPDASGSSGVTTDRAEAVGQVKQELRDAPDGAHGLIRRVALDLVTPEYVTIEVIGEAWRYNSATTWSK